MCYGSVQHIVVLYRTCFIKKLQELLEDEYEDFESLDKVSCGRVSLRTYLAWLRNTL